MAGKNQVTLTFAGDESKLTQSFAKVGDSARSMDTDTRKASSSMRDAGAGFDRAGEAADSFDTKSMGARDGITGIQDSMMGFSALAKGDTTEGLLFLGSGFSDLGSSLYNFVIPSIKAMSLSMVSNAVQTVRSTAASVVHKGAMIAGAAATRVMTVAQRGLNLAMRANPIGIVITVLALLVAGIVIAYRKSETFRAVVQIAMRGVQAAFGWVVRTGGDLVNWFIRLPGKIGSAFSGLASTISGPFRAAFNAVRNFWNNTLGGKGFSIPDWVPEIGGRSFTIPRFHTGGVMPGAPGTEGLALLQAGERITPTGRSASGPGEPQVVEVRVFIGDRELTDIVRTEVRTGNTALRRALRSGAGRLAPA